MTRPTKRYAGPPPRCPTCLDDVPPRLTEEQLRVPTSELYSTALEVLHRTKASSTRGRAEVAAFDPDGDRGRKVPEEEDQEEDGDDEVERFEPDPSKPHRPTPRHYGLYATERASIDWTYHVVPSKSRQALQDEIVSLVLGTQVKECRDAGDDEPCRVSGTGQAELGCQLGDCSGEQDDDGKPLALFTAG